MAIRDDDFGLWLIEFDPGRLLAVSQLGA